MHNLFYLLASAFSSTRIGHGEVGEGKYSVVAAPGSAPDFESSDEVLTCTWMFSFSVGEGKIEERPASSWFAFFNVSTEETRKRFGMLEARGLHLSVKVSLCSIFQPVLIFRNGTRDV